MDWQKTGEGKGGTRRKTAFYEGAYYVERGGDPNHPDFKKKARAVAAKYSEEYDTWRRKTGLVLTARNRAKVAYQEVSLILFSRQ